MSVLGADDGGEPNLTYTWVPIGTPPAPVRFSVNATHGAKNTTATFAQAGNYDFQVTITDAGGFSTTSSVAVTVAQTLTAITVTPGTASLYENGTQQFAATAYDQFGNALASQPSFTWAVTSGVGSINAAGVYTAPGNTGTADLHRHERRGQRHRLCDRTQCRTDGGRAGGGHVQSRVRHEHLLERPGGR